VARACSRRENVQPVDLIDSELVAVDGGVLQQNVALLRSKAGRAPYDRALTDLIGELSTRSELFRTLWTSHDVREHRTGLKRIHHPVVGDLDLNYQGMNLTADRGLLLLAYTAEPGSPIARKTTTACELGRDYRRSRKRITRADRCNGRRLEQKGRRICGPLGGAAGNRTQLRNHLELGKHQFQVRGTTSNDAI
jgi:hypothetical protein